MATPSKKRGDNKQPPQQQYHSRPGRRIKRATERYKRLLGVDRLTPEQKSTVAFMIQPLGHNHD